MFTLLALNTINLRSRASGTSEVEEEGTAILEPHGLRCSK